MVKTCPHGRRTHNCRDCGGKSICEHGKRKNLCRDCDGVSFCEHGKRKYNCRDCGGTNICIHGRLKQGCRDCGSVRFCEHDRIKYTCRDCGGKSICEHGKQKYHCRDCRGAGFCEHGKQKQICRDCGGISFCEHGKRKYNCRDCGGFGFCNHGKQRYQCIVCSPKPCNVEGCYILYACWRDLRNHIKTHAAVYIERKKVKENHLFDALTSAGISLERQTYVDFRCANLGPSEDDPDGKKYAFVDFVHYAVESEIHVEQDEFAHADQVTCDVARATKTDASARLSGDAGALERCRDILRVNGFDAYDGADGHRVKGCSPKNKASRDSVLKKRLPKILELIRHIKKERAEDTAGKLPLLRVHYLFYDVVEGDAMPRLRLQIEDEEEIPSTFTDLIGHVVV